MSRPEGRTPDGFWLVTGDAQRDAIGSNDGLQVDDFARTIGTLTYSKCSSVDGGDASTWVSAGSIGPEGLPATLAVDSTTGGSNIEVSEFDVIKAQDTKPLRLESLAASGTVQASCDGQLTLASSSDKVVVSSATGLTMNNPSPELRVGDGTGTPGVVIDKLATGAANLDFDDAGVIRARLALNASEGLDLERYSAAGLLQGTWMELLATGAITMDDALGLDITAGPLDVGGLATFDANATLDSASPTLLVGDGTGTGANIKVDGTTTAVLQLNTDNSGTSRVNLGNDVADDRCGMRSNSSYIEMIFRAAGGDKVALGSTSIYPSSSSYDLGKSANRFDVAYVETLDADTAILGPTLHVTHHAYSESGAARDYIPWAGTSEGSGITVLSTTGLAPFDGQLKKVQISASGVGGVTTIGFHKNGSTTYVEDHDVNMSSSNTTYTANFTTSTFSKDDRIHVSVDPGTTISLVSVTCTWEYDTRT